MNKNICKWYSQEGCLSRNKDGEPKEDECPEEFEDNCLWNILCSTREDDWCLPDE